MKVSYRWLQELVDFDLNAAALKNRLTDSGVTVETVDSLADAPRGVMVGAIQAVAPHPAADNLLVCTVDVGRSRPLTIVTGAPNVAPGQRVPVAAPGARLPGGQTIETAEFRGVRSEGMLCAPDELGIDEGHDAILVLGADSPIGADVAPLLGLDDQILQLDLTPNVAAHCQSMLGVAQEVAAALAGQVRAPKIAVAELPGTDIGSMIEVEIADPDLCRRYVGRIIKGVKVGPSPAWLQAKVRAAGMRPISNVVDITNLVMMEMGQPLHAFDYDTIGGKKIVVRRARPGERLRTLDGVDRVLDADILVIADQTKPVGLAGVMGGENSEISAATTTIFLESAWFEPINNRRTARRLGLPSEASSRFTRGVDPAGSALAADRAAQLFAEVAGGQVVAGRIDVYANVYPPRVLTCRPERMRLITGIDMDRREMIAILGRLGFGVLDAGHILELGEGSVTEMYGEYTGVKEVNPVWDAVRRVSPVPADAAAYRQWAAAAEAEVERARAEVARLLAEHPDLLLVVAPTRRLDINSEIDLSEELARIYGYDRIEATLPTGRLLRGGRSRGQQVRLAARRILAGAGLSEVMTYSLIHRDVYDRLRLAPKSPLRRVVQLQNPLYEERSSLRTTLLPGMLDVLAYNLSRGLRDMRIFEISAVYLPREGQDLPDEPLRLALAALGDAAAKGWQTQRQAVDFFYLKGVLEHLCERLGIQGWQVQASDHPTLHPGRQADWLVAGRTVGMIGEVHPDVQAAWDLPSRVYVAELDFDALLAAVADLRPYRSVPRYPAVLRDLAVVVPDRVPAAEVEAVIRTAGGALLSEVRLFDLYRGQGIAAGRRSLAYSLVYRAADRTLTEDEVEVVHAGIRQALVQEADAELRS